MVLAAPGTPRAAAQRSSRNAKLQKVETMHFLNRKHKISWFRRSPNGPRICSNCVPGASPGALGAPWDPRSVSEFGLGCPHGLRGPLWGPNLTPRMVRGAHEGIQNQVRIPNVGPKLLQVHPETLREHSWRRYSNQWADFRNPESLSFLLKK